MVDGQWPEYGILLWSLALVPLLALTVQVFRGNAPGSLTELGFGGGWRQSI